MGRVVTNYVSDHTKWINEMLAKNPADRFESGAAFAQALRDLNVVGERS